MPSASHRTAPSATNPYLELAAAVVHQAIRDAQSRPRNHARHEPAIWPTPSQIRDAQAFLRTPEWLAAWVELLGADMDVIQPRLLQAAGMPLPSKERDSDERTLAPRQ